MATLLLVGATGLVGQSVLRQALQDPRVTRVVAPTRRPLAAHARLENPVCEFESLPESAPWWKADAVICTLGTTIKKAGSRENFRRVDFGYPVAVGELARRAGTPVYALNSSVGARKEAGTFYLRIKGEVENAIRALGFSSVTIVRPSVLAGHREEFRAAERASLALMGLFRPFIPARYRPVHADRVAASLLAYALAAKPGITVIESESI